MLGSAQVGTSASGMYVNAANGNLVLQRRDEFLAGHGPETGLLRTYNSRARFDGDNDDGWRVGSARTVTLYGEYWQAGSTVTRVAADGAELSYRYDIGRNAYVRADRGGDDRLTRDKDGLWHWIDGATLDVESYDKNGRLDQTRDSDGNIVQYHYNDNGLLDWIDSGARGRMVLEYKNPQHPEWLTAVRLQQDGRDYQSTHYAYDSKGRLSTVKVDLTPDDRDDAAFYLINYGYYDEPGRDRLLKTLSESDGTNVEFFYEEQGETPRVVRLADHAAQRETHFDYALDRTRVRELAIDRTNPATPRLIELANTVLSYDAVSQSLVAVELYSGDQPPLRTEYRYDAAGRVVQAQVIGGNNNHVAYGYDGQGNLNYERDADGVTVERLYRDGLLLRETGYTVVDPDGEGAGRPSGALHTRHVYDAAKSRLRFTVSPEGRVVEYRYDGKGLRTAELVYDGEMFLQGPPDAEIAIGTLEKWAEKRTRVQRTDYGYDAAGQLNSTLSYERVQGAGHDGERKTATETRFVYDHQGRLLKTIDPRKDASGDEAGTSFVYDGLGRLLLSTDIDKTQTKYVYSNRPEGGSQVAISAPGGRQTVKVYGAQGHLLSVKELSGGGVSQFFYDALGRLRYGIDETGRGSAVLYDALGRKIGEVDGEGALTEFSYDREGRLALTRRYATLLGAEARQRYLAPPKADTTVVDLDAPGARPAFSNEDRIERRFYDAGGRLGKQLDADGYLTGYRYDGAGRLVETIRYAEAIAIDAIALDTPAKLVRTPKPDAADRHSRRFYDGDGKLLAELDAENALVEYRYDGAGRLIETIAYAERPKQPGAASLDELEIVADAEQDRRSERRYDARGRLVAERDAGGYVSLHEYDVVGNRTSTTRLSKASAEPLPASEGLSAWRDRLALSAAETDRRIDYQYDLQNRVRLETQWTGQSSLTKIYSYDAAGRLLSVVQRDAQASSGVGAQRSTYQQYDALGRVIRELSGVGASELTTWLSTVGGGLPPTQTQVNEIWDSFAISYRYDEAGRRIKMSQPNAGRPSYDTFYYYDDAGRLQYTVNPLGEVSELRYGATGEVESTLRYTRRLASSVALNGGRADVAFENAVRALADGSESRTDRYYDRRGLLQSETVWQGADGSDAFSRQRLVYNAFGELEQRFERSGAQGQEVLSEHVFSRDRRGAVTERLSGGVYVETKFDVFGRAVKVSTGSRHDGVNGAQETTQGYDRLGRVILTESGTADQVWSRRSVSYDAFDRILTQSDTLAGRDGRLIDTETATVSYRYDDARRQISMSSPGGITTSLRKNAFGETEITIDGLGNVTTHIYDPAGRLIKVKNPDGTEARNAYDSKGNLWYSVDSSGLQVDYTYDAVGRVLTKTVDPQGLKLVSSYLFDDQRRQIRETGPDKLVTLTEYSRDGRKLRVVVDPQEGGRAGLHLETRYQYDSRGNVTTVEQGFKPDGHKADAYSKVRYFYDDAGRRYREVVDPDNLALETLYFFDNLGNVAAKRDPAGRVTTFYRDALGRVAITVNGAGEVEENIFDAAGRVIEKRGYRKAYPEWSFGGGTADLQELSFNADQVRRHLDASKAVRTQLFYDDDGRLAWSVDPTGAITGYLYDDNGNLLRETRYAELLRGTPSQRMTPAPSDLDRIVEYVYDTLNRPIYRIELERVPKEGRERAVYETRTRYDAAGRVSRVTGVPLSESQDGTRRRVAGEPVETLYRYDKLGRRIYEVDNQGGVKHTQYDAAGRVKSVTERVGASALDAQSLRFEGSFDIKMSRRDRDVVVLEHQGERALITSDMSLQDIVDAAPWMMGWFQQYLKLTFDLTQFSPRPPAALSLPGQGAAMAELRSTMARFWRELPLQTEVSWLGGKVKRTASDRASFTFGQPSRTVEIERAASSDPRYLYALLRDWLEGAGKERLDVGLAVESFGPRLSTGQNLIEAQTLLEKVFWAVPADTAALAAREDRTVQYEYDHAGRLKKVTDAAGNFEEYAYDALSRKTLFTNKLGGQTEYGYDSAGRLRLEVAPSASSFTGGTISADSQVGATRAVTKMVYDASGNLLERWEGGFGNLTDQNWDNARVTRFSYDAAGRQLALEQPSQLQTTFRKEWDKFWNGIVSGETIKWDLGQVLGNNAPPLNVTFKGEGVAEIDGVEIRRGMSIEEMLEKLPRLKTAVTQQGWLQYEAADYFKVADPNKAAAFKAYWDDFWNRSQAGETLAWAKGTLTRQADGKALYLADGEAPTQAKLLRPSMGLADLAKVHRNIRADMEAQGYQFAAELRFETEGQRKALLDIWTDYWEHSVPGEWLKLGTGRLVRKENGLAEFVDEGGEAVELKRGLIDPSKGNIEEQINALGRLHPQLLDLFRFFKYQFDIKYKIDQQRHGQLQGLWEAYWSGPVYGEELDLGQQRSLRRYAPGLAAFKTSSGQIYTLRRDMSLETMASLHADIRAWLVSLVPGLKLPEPSIKTVEGGIGEIQSFWGDYWSRGLIGETWQWAGGTLRREGPQVATYIGPEPERREVRITANDPIEVVVNLDPHIAKAYRDQGFQIGTPQNVTNLGRMTEAWQAFWNKSLTSAEVPFYGGVLRRELPRQIAYTLPSGQVENKLRGVARYVPNGNPAGAVELFEGMSLDDVAKRSPELKRMFEEMGVKFDAVVNAPAAKLDEMMAVWQGYFSGVVIGESRDWAKGKLVRTGADSAKYVFMDRGVQREIVLSRAMTLKEAAALHGDIAAELARAPGVEIRDWVPLEGDLRSQNDWQALFDRPQAGAVWNWARGQLRRDADGRITYVVAGREMFSFDRSASLQSLADRHPDFAEAFAKLGFKLGGTVSETGRVDDLKKHWQIFFDSALPGERYDWAGGALVRTENGNTEFVARDGGKVEIRRGMSLAEMAALHPDIRAEFARQGYQVNSETSQALDRLRTDWLARFDKALPGERLSWAQGQLVRQADGSTNYIASSGAIVTLRPEMSLEAMARLHPEIAKGFEAYGFVMGDESVMLADWRAYFDQALSGETRSFGKGTLVRRQDGGLDYRGANGVTVRLDKGVTVEAAALLHPEIAEVFALEGFNLGDRPVLQAGDLKTLTAQWQSYFDRAQAGETMEWAEGVLTRQADGTVLYRSYVFGGTTVLRREMSIEQMARAHTGLMVAFSRLYGFRMESRATVLAAGDQARMDAEWNAYFAGRFNGESLDWAGGRLVRQGDGSAVYQAPGGGSAVLTVGMSIAQVARAHPALAAYFETQGFKLATPSGNPTVLVGREAELLQHWNNYFDALVLEKSYSLWGGTLVRLDHSTVEFHYGGNRYQLNRNMEIPALSQLVPEITNFYRRSKETTVEEIDRSQLQSDWNLFWSTIPVGWSGSWGGGQITRTGPDSAFYRGNDGSQLSFGRGASLDTLLGNASIKKAFTRTRTVTTTWLDEAQFQQDWQGYWRGVVPNEATPLFDGTLTRKVDGSVVFSNAHGSVAFNRQSNFSALYLANQKVFGAWAAAFGYRLSTDGQVVDNRGEAALRGFLDRYFGGKVVGESISMWGGTLTRQADGSSRYTHPAGSIDMVASHTKAGLAVQSATLGRAWNERYGFKADMVPQIIERGREAELRAMLDVYWNGRTPSETLSIYGGTLSRHSNGEVRFQNAQGSIVVKRDSDLLRLAADNAGLAQAWKQTFGIEVTPGRGVIERGNEAALQSLLERYLAGRFEGDSVSRWGGTLSRNVDGSATFTSASGSLKIGRDADLNQLAAQNKELAAALLAQYGFVPGKGVGAVKQGDLAGLQNFWKRYWDGRQAGETQSWLGGTWTRNADGSATYRKGEETVVVERGADLAVLAGKSRVLAQAFKEHYGYVPQAGQNGPATAGLQKFWDDYWKGAMPGERLKVLDGTLVRTGAGTADYIDAGGQVVQVGREADFAKWTQQSATLKAALKRDYDYAIASTRDWVGVNAEQVAQLNAAWGIYWEGRADGEEVAAFGGVWRRNADGSAQFKTSTGEWRVTRQEDLSALASRDGSRALANHLVGKYGYEARGLVFRSEAEKAAVSQLWQAYFTTPLPGETLKLEFGGQAFGTLTRLDGGGVRFDAIGGQPGARGNTGVVGAGASYEALARDCPRFADFLKAVFQASIDRGTLEKVQQQFDDYWNHFFLRDGLSNREMKLVFLNENEAEFTDITGKRLTVRRDGAGDSNAKLQGYLTALVQENRDFARWWQATSGFSSQIRSTVSGAGGEASLDAALKRYWSGPQTGETIAMFDGTVTRNENGTATYYAVADGRMSGLVFDRNTTFGELAMQHSTLARALERERGFKVEVSQRIESSQPGGDMAALRADYQAALNRYFDGSMAGEVYRHSDGQFVRTLEKDGSIGAVFVDAKQRKTTLHHVKGASGLALELELARAAADNKLLGATWLRDFGLVSEYQVRPGTGQQAEMVKGWRDYWDKPVIGERLDFPGYGYFKRTAANQVTFTTEKQGDEEPRVLVLNRPKTPDSPESAPDWKLSNAELLAWLGQISLDEPALAGLWTNYFSADLRMAVLKHGSATVGLMLDAYWQGSIPGEIWKLPVGTLVRLGGGDLEFRPLSGNPVRFGRDKPLAEVAKAAPELLQYLQAQGAFSDIPGGKVTISDGLNRRQNVNANVRSELQRSFAALWTGTRAGAQAMVNGVQLTRQADGSAKTSTGVNITRTSSLKELAASVPDGTKLWSGLADNAGSMPFADDAAFNGASLGLDSVGRTDLVPRSETYHDELGNAVAYRDVGGNWSYKTYDDVGRIRFEIDAEAYVTEYEYDAFGNRTALIRYANRKGVPTTGRHGGYSLGDIESWATGQGEGLYRKIGYEYDARGRLLRTVEPSGINLEVSVTGEAQLLTGKKTTHLVYDGQGRVVQQRVEDDEHRVLSSGYSYYDNLGRKIAQVDAGGYLTEWKFDRFGAVIEEIEYAAALTDSFDASSSVNVLRANAQKAAGKLQLEYNQRNKRYTYDRLGQVKTESRTVTTSDVDGARLTQDVTQSYDYDAAGNQTSITDGRGNKTIQVFDMLGRKVRVEEATSKQTLTDKTEAVFYRYVSTDYDLFGNAVRVRRAAPSADQPDLVELRRFDAGGRALSLQTQQVFKYTVPAGQEKSRQLSHSEWRYDAFGRALVEWQSNVSESFAGVVAGMTPTSVRNNAVKLFKYDAAGRRIETSERVGVIGKTGETSAVDANWVANRVEYDAFGDIVRRRIEEGVGKTVSKSAVTGEYVYDNAGRLKLRSEGGVATRFFYNALGLETAQVVSPTLDLMIEDARIDWQSKLIDPQGKIARNVDPAYRRSYNAYDSSGRLVRQFSPSFLDGAGQRQDVETQISYDRWGNRLSMVDAMQAKFEWRYDSNNKVTKEILPVTQVVGANGFVSEQAIVRQYGYNALGDLKAKRDANGTVREYAYDDFGRQTREYLRGADKDSDYLSKTVYDSFGRVLWQYQDSRGGYFNYHYDALDRVITIERKATDHVNNIHSGENGITHYRYDGLGRQTSTIQVAEKLANASSPYGNWTAMDGVHIQLTEYDTLGRVTASEAGEKTEGVERRGLRRAQRYDALGNKIESQTSWLGKDNKRQFDAALTWEYSLATGRLERHTDLGAGKYTYQYNKAGELSSQDYERSITFESDPIRQTKPADGTTPSPTPTPTPSPTPTPTPTPSPNPRPTPTPNPGDGDSRHDLNSLPGVVALAGGGFIERRADGRWFDDQGENWTQDADGTLQNREGLRVSPRRENEKPPVPTPVPVPGEGFAVRVAKHTRTFEYDGAGRLIKQVDEDNSVPEVDKDGNAIKYLASLDEGTVTQTKAYDKLGRLLTESVTRVWDQAISGRREAGATEQWAQTNSYDALGRLVSTRTSGNTTSTDLAMYYAYDANGNRRAVLGAVRDVTDPLVGAWRGYINWYDYDQLDRMTISRGVLEGTGVTLSDTHELVQLMPDPEVRAVAGKKLGFALAERKREEPNANVPVKLTSSEITQEGKQTLGGGTRISYVGNTLLREKVTTLTKHNALDTRFDEGVTQSFEYDPFGRVKAVSSQTWKNGGPVTPTSDTGKEKLVVLKRQYDALGRVSEEANWKDGALTQKRVNVYDADGRLLQQETFATEATYHPLSRNVYDYSGEKLNSMTFTALGKDSWQEIYTYSYTAFETWKETSQLREVTGSQSRHAKSYSVLNDYGQVTAIWQATRDHGGTGNESLKPTFVPSQVRRFFTDSDGRVLWRFDESSLGLDSPNRMDESAWLTNPYALPNKTPNNQGVAYAYAGGSVIGSSGKKIEESDFDFNFIDLSANALPQSTMDSYVTNQGDTLQSIALGRWGDASLWYLIANENNAFDTSNKPAGPTSPLKAGQSLKMPWVVSAANKSDTFRPYNPTKVIGSTTPDLPAPPPPPKPDGCGVVGSIIMIVVMVVATIFTAGAATVAMSAGLQGLMATGVSGIMSAGMAALAPAALASMSLGGAMALGAVSSAVGSIASQAAGVALGMQDEINWKGVGKAALTGAIGGAVGASGIGKAVENSKFITSVGEYSKMAATALSTMATSTISQGLMSATGVSSFSWRNVAAAGVTAAVSQSLGNKLFGSAEFDGQGLRSVGEDGANWLKGHDFAANLIQGVADGTVNRLAQMAFGSKGKLEFRSIAANAFGDVLGRGIAGAMGSRTEFEIPELMQPLDPLDMPPQLMMLRPEEDPIEFEPSDFQLNWQQSRRAPARLPDVNRSKKYKEVALTQQLTQGFKALGRRILDNAPSYLSMAVMEMLPTWAPHYEETKEDKIRKVYKEAFRTTLNGASLAAGNFVPDAINGSSDWFERFFHMDSGQLGRLDPWVIQRNEVAQEVAQDFRGIAGVALALTPIKTVRTGPGISGRVLQSAGDAIVDTASSLKGGSRAELRSVNANSYSSAIGFYDDMSDAITGGHRPASLRPEHIKAFDAWDELQAGGDGVFNSIGRMKREGSRPLQTQPQHLPHCTVYSSCMAIETMGKKAAIDDVLSQLTVNPANGVKFPDLKKVFDGYGLSSTRSVNFTIDDIRLATQKGTPAVARVLQSSFDPIKGVPTDAIGHAVVIDGVTKKNGIDVVAVRDPQGYQYFERADKFNKRSGMQIFFFH